MNSTRFLNIGGGSGIPESEKGQADGIATLDANAKVPAIELNIATDQNIIDKTSGALLDASRVAPDDITNVNSDVTLPTVNAVKNLVGNATAPRTRVGDCKSSWVTNDHDGWLLEHGSERSRTEYPLLFALLGTSQGAGDGSTTFNLPDSRGRVTVGAGQVAGLTNRVIGEKFGEEGVTLIVAQLPAHNHSIDHDHGSFTSGSSGDETIDNGEFGLIRKSSGDQDTVQTADFSAGEPDLITSPSGWSHSHTIDVPNYIGASGNTGSNQPHNNMQPSIAKNIFIYAGV